MILIPLPGEPGGGGVDHQAPTDNGADQDQGHGLPVDRTVNAVGGEQRFLVVVAPTHHHLGEHDTGPGSNHNTKNGQENDFGEPSRDASTTPWALNSVT